jgi:segregation and condensation protein A
MKEEVDLLEVPLVEVISAYLQDMESAGAIGYWDDMTEFLLLMSLLVEVKSRMLLPGAYVEIEEELTPEQARDRLLARLFEYSKFKAAAAWLRELGEASAASRLRGGAGEVKLRLLPLEEVAGSGDAMELRDSLQRLIARRGEPDASHIIQIKVELRRQINVIRDILAKQSRFSFNRVFGGEEPLVQALSVFALLDLLTRGEVKVYQGEPFGDILIRRAEKLTTA